MLWQKLFLQKWFIFNNHHEKDFDQYRFLITKINLPFVGGTIICLSSDSPRLPAQSHNIPWDGSLRSVPVFLPHISKMDPLHWWCHVNMWRLGICCWTLCRLCWSICEEKDGQWTHRNLRPRPCHKVWGVVLSGKTYVFPKAVFDKCKLTQTLKCKGNALWWFWGF